MKEMPRRCHPGPNESSSAGPGGRAACAPAQGPWQEGAQTQVYTCIMYTAQPKKQRGRQAASRTIIVGTAIWQRGRQASAIWHRDRAGLSVGESIGGRRLVWSGVSASRAGALGTGHRRHWFVVSRKELQALLYSSPSFVRSCLRPGRIRTPGNH